MEVFTQRLEDEYNASVIVTPPSVPYKLKLRNIKKYSNVDTDNIITVSNPNEWPLEMDVEEQYEPMVRGTLIFPSEYLSAVTSLAAESRGQQNRIEYIDQTRIRMEYSFPLSEILTRFFDTLKRNSS